MTYTKAAKADHAKKLQTTSYPRDPGHSNKKKDAEDVLDAWKEDAQECTKFLLLQTKYIKRIRCSITS